MASGAAPTQPKPTRGRARRLLVFLAVVTLLVVGAVTLSDGAAPTRPGGRAGSTAEQAQRTLTIVTEADTLAVAARDGRLTVGHLEKAARDAGLDVRFVVEKPSTGPDVVSVRIADDGRSATLALRSVPDGCAVGHLTASRGVVRLWPGDQGVNCSGVVVEKLGVGSAPPGPAPVELTDGSADTPDTDPERSAAPRDEQAGPGPGNPDDPGQPTRADQPPAPAPTDGPTATDPAPQPDTAPPAGRPHTGQPTPRPKPPATPRPEPSRTPNPTPGTTPTPQPTPAPTPPPTTPTPEPGPRPPAAPQPEPGPRPTAAPQPEPAVAPDAPTGVNAAARAADLEVTFDPPANNLAAGVTGYTVTATNTSTGETVTVSGTGSPLLLTGLTAGGTYTVTVTATGTAGQSSPSDPSPPVTMPVPAAAPTGVTATLVGDAVEVSFAAPANADGAAVTGYTATATNIGTGETVTVSGPASPLLLTGVPAGGTYTVTVTATGTLGDSVPSEPSNLLAVPVIPAPPTAVTATLVGSSVEIAFTEPPNATEAGVTGYVVSSSDGLVTVTTGTSPVLVTACFAPEVTFTVAAVTADGTRSAPSEPSNPVTVPLPEPPGNVAVAVVGAALEVSFTPPANATEADVTGYTATATGTGETVTVSGAASPLKLTGLTPGATYTVTVVAGSEIAQSPPSEPVEVTFACNNDLFACSHPLGAPDVERGTVSADYTHAGATQQTGEPGPTTRWFTFTAPASGTYHVRMDNPLVGSSYGNNWLHVYNDGPAPGQLGGYIARNSRQTTNPAVSFFATAGTTYRVAPTAAYGTTSGGYRITVGRGPANDAFVNATDLTAALTAAGYDGVWVSDDVDLTYSGLEPGDTWAGVNSAWWVFTAPATGTYRVTMDNPLTGTASGSNWLYVFGDGAGPASVTQLARNSSQTQNPSLTWFATEGTTYRLRTAMSYGGSAKHRLRVNLSPSNDAFANAFDATADVETLAPGGTWFSHDVSVAHAGLEPGESFSGNTKSIWWKFTAPVSGNYTVTMAHPSAGSTDGSNWLHVLTDGASVSQVTSIGRNSSQTTNPSVTFTATAGTSYRVITTPAYASYVRSHRLAIRRP